MFLQKCKDLFSASKCIKQVDFCHCIFTEFYSSICTVKFFNNVCNFSKFVADLFAMRWTRHTDRRMTAGAMGLHVDLGWVAVWTHSTSWNVEVISTNRAWMIHPRAHLKEGKSSFICYCWTLSVFSDYHYFLFSFTPITWQTTFSFSLLLSISSNPFIPFLLLLHLLWQTPVYLAIPKTLLVFIELSLINL